MAKSVFRCAVYTRKSHEEGLDQDFNSLDAQYEACSAYIASQAGLGWKLRGARYDDGGISGGHMDRPALQELIVDIKAGLIDIIVVYKVDRLTRSLTDFAKLVDLFDTYDVSFVSVTQAFNTTTSMGRLTLNVLLSFAQFEREVTAERIRDKFAASKKKGIWMGGICPFGYGHKDRKLHINDEEAQIIRSLYQLYVQLKNVRLVKVEADKLGFLTRRRIQKSGKRTGGAPFSRGHIYRILCNPIYIGKIQHKDKVYAGEHDAIIPKELWDQVQAIKTDNTVQRKRAGNIRSNKLLAGLLFDHQNHKLVPHTANKTGTRYHYYVSQKLKTGDQDSGWRIPARTIEQALLSRLKQLFASKETILELVSHADLSADDIQRICGKGRYVSEQIKMGEGNHQDLKILLNELIDKIILHTDKILIYFNRHHLSELLGIKLSSDKLILLTQPMTLRRRGQEMKLVIGGEANRPSNPDPALIKLIAKAHCLKTELNSGTVKSIKEFAAKYGMDHGDAKNLVPLGYLAPTIVADILDGKQPLDLTARNLKYLSNLPVNWNDQRQVLGFN